MTVNGRGKRWGGEANGSEASWKRTLCYDSPFNRRKDMERASVRDVWRVHQADVLTALAMIGATSVYATALDDEAGAKSCKMCGREGGRYEENVRRVWFSLRGNDDRSK